VGYLPYPISKINRAWIHRLEMILELSKKYVQKRILRANWDYHFTRSKRQFYSSLETNLKQGSAMSGRLKERAYPMLNYAPPCLQKFLQGTLCSPILPLMLPHAFFKEIL
jgi:hypothetical protein